MTTKTTAKKNNTRKTDEEVLIQFVEDQGFDNPELVAAANRLKEALRKGLQDYSNFG